MFNMKEYIEREALLKGIDEFHHTAHIQSLTRETEEEKTLWKGIHSGVNYSRNHILEAPAADVEPVRHGEWIPTGEETMFSREVKCNQCGIKLLGEPNYCPNCGAKMDGGK
jgi:rubrerythrin